MSAPNFRTMRDFPLFVIEDQYFKRCPCCDLWMDGETETCECGASLEDVEAEYDEFETSFNIKAIERYIEQNAPRLDFYKITVEGGYYTGAQLYVEEEHPQFPDVYDNDDCHYYFDCCRSRAIRNQKSEIRKVEKFMRQVAREFGLDEYYCGGIFSNGEAVYSKVPDKTSTKREKLKYILATS